MQDLYGLSYLLFKHGSMLHRRLKQVTKEFVYRTCLAMCIHFTFFVCSGFSITMPLKMKYFMIFMSVLSPLMYWVEAIFHIEYGQRILHRVFGEYKNNQVNSI